MADARVLAIALALVAGTGTASAADLGSEPPPPPDPRDWCNQEQVELDHQVEVIGWQLGMTSGLAVDRYQGDYGSFTFINYYEDEEERGVWVYEVTGFARDAYCAFDPGLPDDAVVEAVIACIGSLLEPDPGGVSHRDVLTCAAPGPSQQQDAPGPGP